MERALEEVQGGVGLAFELFLAELEPVAGFRGHSMRIYTHTLGNQNRPVNNKMSIQRQKRRRFQLNYYAPAAGGIGVKSSH